MSSTETTRATLHELLSRLGRFEPEPVAALLADTLDWDVPGDERVPWTGPRSSRDEVAAYFRTLWSVCDTAQADTAVSQMLVDGADAVVLGVFKQTIRATGRRDPGGAAHHRRRRRHYPAADIRGLLRCRPRLRRGVMSR